MNTNVNVINTTIDTESAAQVKARPDILSILAIARYFLPILASVGGLLWAFIPGDSFFYSFGVMLMCIGFVSAFTVCPLKLLAFPFICLVGGFKICRGFIPYYGIGDLIAGLVGTCLGFGFGLIVIMTCPAFFTIKKFLEQ